MSTGVATAVKMEATTPLPRITENCMSTVGTHATFISEHEGAPDLDAWRSGWPSVLTT